jgi:hypothetical protein
VRTIAIAWQVLFVLGLTGTTAYPQAWRNATSFSKVSLRGLTTRQRAEALEMLREEDCTCGCGMKLAQCLVDDPNCPLSPRLGQHVASLAARNHSALSITRGVWYRQMVSRDVANADPGGFVKGTSRQNSNVVYYEFETCKSGRYQCDKCNRWHREIGASEAWPLDYPNRLQSVLERFRRYHSDWLTSSEIAATENNIIGQLNRIDRFQGSDQELYRSLAADLRSGFEKLDRAVIRHFERLGKSARLAGPSPCAAPAGRFDGGVEITTTPARAELFYLDERRFDIIYPLKMVNSNRRVWDELGSTTGVFRRKLPPGEYRVYSWWSGVRRYTYSRKLSIPEGSSATIRVSLSAY